MFDGREVAPLSATYDQYFNKSFFRGGSTAIPVYGLHSHPACSHLVLLPCYLPIIPRTSCFAFFSLSLPLSVFFFSCRPAHWCLLSCSLCCLFCCGSLVNEKHLSQQQVTLLLHPRDPCYVSKARVSSRVRYTTPVSLRSLSSLRCNTVFFSGVTCFRANPERTPWGLNTSGR